MKPFRRVHVYIHQPPSDYSSWVYRHLSAAQPQPPRSHRPADNTTAKHATAEAELLPSSTEEGVYTASFRFSQKQQPTNHSETKLVSKQVTVNTGRPLQPNIPAPYTGVMTAMMPSQQHVATSPSMTGFSKSLRLGFGTAIATSLQATAEDVPLQSLKAKFHYASWFAAGSKHVRSHEFHVDLNLAFI